MSLKWPTSALILLTSLSVGAQPLTGVTGATSAIAVPLDPATAPAAVATPPEIQSETLTVEGPTAKFSFQNEDLLKVVEAYARWAEIKIIVDPNLRGRITILNPGPVSVRQAYEDLSLALSLEGMGFSRVGDTLVLRSARNLQRGLIEVKTTLPAVKPERMVTYVLKLKNIPAVAVNRDIRILLSKDGEMVPDANSNSLIITDWTSNLQRVHNVMMELDVPANAKMAKKNAAASSPGKDAAATPAPPKGKSGR